jgi:vancomycin permeability regulator SanA
MVTVARWARGCPPTIGPASYGAGVERPRLQARAVVGAVIGRIRARWRLFVALGLVLSAPVLGPPLTVLAVTADQRYDDPDQVPSAPVALVLGAVLSPSGELSPFLAERVATAVALYHEDRVQALLMSGDHCPGGLRRDRSHGGGS